MWSRTVETAVKLGFAVNRGSVDGNVVPAVDGTKPTFPVFSERPDVGTTIAVGYTVAIVTDSADREIYVILGNTVTEFQFGMSDSNGAWIPATTPGNYTGSVQFLQSGVTRRCCESPRRAIQTSVTDTHNEIQMSHPERSVAKSKGLHPNNCSLCLGRTTTQKG